jgi:hypothetical protein
MPEPHDPFANRVTRLRRPFVAIVGYALSDDPLTVAVGLTFAEIGLWFRGPLPGTVRRPG